MSLAKLPPSPSSNSPFRVTSSHLSVTIAEQRIVPGSIIQGSVSPNGKFTKIEVSLIGETDVAIFGKDRWQVGQAMAGGGMGGGGIMPPVTSREIHRFLQVSQDLPLSPNEHSKKDLKAVEAHGSVDGGIGFSIQVPFNQYECKCRDHQKPMPLPPSCSLPIGDPTNASSRYRIRIRGYRQGAFKRDDKLRSSCMCICSLIDLLHRSGWTLK